MDVVSEIVFEPSQQGTADAESVELLEPQFVVNPVDTVSKALTEAR